MLWVNPNKNRGRLVGRVEILSLIKGNPFFEDFDDEEREAVADIDIRILHFEEGSYIIREKGVGSALFILLQGEVAITKNEAPESELNRLKVGALFGELPLITGSPRSTNVIAKGKVVVMIFDGEVFKGLEPKIFHKFNGQFFKLLAKRLDQMNYAMADIKTKLERFSGAYELIKTEIEKIPTASDEFKVIQSLWSSYFQDLRSK